MTNGETRGGDAKGWLCQDLGHERADFGGRTSGCAPFSRTWFVSAERARDSGPRRNE